MKAFWRRSGSPEIVGSWSFGGKAVEILTTVSLIEFEIVEGVSDHFKNVDRLLLQGELPSLDR